jgi:hypothetical protein
VKDTPEGVKFDSQNLKHQLIASHKRFGTETMAIIDYYKPRLHYTTYPDQDSDQYP